MSPTVRKVHCSFCNVAKDAQFYAISKLRVSTKGRADEVGMLSLLKELNRYTMEKMYHLSASEIILLRPDILVEFLTAKYKESIISYSFIEHRICSDCFLKYKALVPEK